MIHGFAAMLSDTAPGLRFGPHAVAGVGERVYSTPHEAGPPASDAAVAEIGSLCGRDRRLRDSLLSVWGPTDGVGLCRMPNVTKCFALQLYPVAAWAEATEGVRRDFDDGWLERNYRMYARWPWRVVGGFGAGGLRLVVFFGGRRRLIHPLAGCCTCVGGDSRLDPDLVLTPSVPALLRAAASEICEVLEIVGVTGWIRTDDGALYGDPPVEYLPDIREHPGLVDEGH